MKNFYQITRDKELKFLGNFLLLDIFAVADLETILIGA